MKNFLIITLLCMTFLAACDNHDIVSDVGYKKISAEDAYRIMQNTNDYILLDVRTDEEFMEKHIEGAVLIPDNEIGIRSEIELPDKDALILVYCRSGRRSANAANELIEMGYTNVYDFGGINDWPYDTLSEI